MKLLMKKGLLFFIILLSHNVFAQSFFVNDSVIKQLRKNIESIDTNNLDAVNVNDIKLDESEVKLNEIKYKIKAAKLDFKNPNSEIEYGKLCNKIEKLRATINRQNQGLDRLYFNKGINYLEKDNDPQNAYKYLERSLVVNPLYIPSLYRLSLLNRQDGNLKKAGEFITIILNKTYPAFADQHTFLKLANDLIDDFVNKIKEYNLQEKFSEANDMLDVAMEYCSANQKLSCKETLNKLKAETKYGIYRSYTDIAESAIKSKHSEQAENFIFSALKYKKQNMHYLSDRMDAENILNQIIDVYLEKASKSVNAGGYVKAMGYFEKASALCDSSGKEDCHEKIKLGMSRIKINIYNEFIAKASAYIDKGQTSLAEDYLNKAKIYKNSNVSEIRDTTISENIMQKIKFLQYKKLIKDAEINFSNGEYVNTLKDIDNAEEIRRRYDLENIKGKDTIMKFSAKKIINDKLKTCDIKIWGNELAEVIEIINTAKAMQSKYLLQNDKEVSKWIEELKKKVNNKECENAGNEYALMMFKADGFVQKLDFIEANSYYDKAVQLSKKNPDCNINAAKAIEYNNKYDKAIAYQKMIEKANNYYYNKDYNRFLSAYFAAENYFINNDVKVFGLKHMLIYDYVLRKNNDELILAGVSFFADNKNAADAMKLLEYLRAHNFPKEKTKQSQIKAGIIIAQTEFKLSKSNSPEGNNIKNNIKDKWFVYFKDSYKNESRKLKKI